MGRCTFGEWEVEDAVRRARRGKTPGLYGIRVELLQKSWGILKGSLVRLYNGCIKYGVFPNLLVNVLIRAENSVISVVDLSTL